MKKLFSVLPVGSEFNYFHCNYIKVYDGKKHVAVPIEGSAKGFVQSLDFSNKTVEVPLMFELLSPGDEFTIDNNTWMKLLTHVTGYNCVCIRGNRKGQLSYQPNGVIE